MMSVSGKRTWVCEAWLEIMAQGSSIISGTGSGRRIRREKEARKGGESESNRSQGRG